MEALETKIKNFLSLSNDHCHGDVSGHGYGNGYGSVFGYGYGYGCDDCDVSGHGYGNCDGYQSWSPAEPFEKAYKPSDTFIERLRIERNELNERYQKLCSFTNIGFVLTVHGEYYYSGLSRKQLIEKIENL